MTMRALSVIEAEHRNMWRMAVVLDALARRLPQGADVTDLQTIDLVIDYFLTFTEKFHHPKEEEYLFSRLRQRSNEAGGMLDRLAYQHEMSPKQLDRIQLLLASPHRDEPSRLEELAKELISFHDRLGEHMRLEEDVAFVMARKVLTADDWREVDAAFAAHVDPLDEEGHGGRESVALLRSRITQILPEPEGLGGHIARASQATQHEAPAPAPAGMMLEVKDLVTRYGRIEALHGLSIQVRQGQLVALVGANGAGKTTTLRCISGVQPVAGGSIMLRGEAITTARPDARVRAGVCQVPEGRQVFAPMTIEDNLRMGAYTRPASEIAAGLEEVYGLFPILQEKRELPAGTLSGGQQQMLALGRALMGKPQLLLLDEPSMGLAPLIVEEIFRIIRMLKQNGITILLVEQNARAALSVADHAYVIETGRVTLQGPGPELLANDEVRRAYLGM
jgi:branched-chain amino acid transport system ATP-binding protein